MTQLDFSFEPSPWEATVDTLQPGSKLSAARFLALMETETDEDLEDALAALDQRDILLDISDLPKPEVTGDTGLRLRREAQLVAEGKLPEGLDENDPLRLYLEEIAQIMTSGDAKALAQQLLSGDKSSVPMLTNLMLSRVLDKAYAMTNRGVLLMDLIQDGSLGLWQAILCYNGGDILAHCERFIERAVAKTVTLQARASGIGQKLCQAMEDFRSADQLLLTRLGRNPTLEEIAAELGMSLEEASAVAETLEAARLMERAKIPEKQAKMQEEDDQAVEDTAYFQMRQRIAELLSGLDERDVQLVTLRYGLEGGLPFSPEDTGRKLGMTPEEVVARESEILMKLRENG